MINSTTSTDRTVPTASVSVPSPAIARQEASRKDLLSTENAAFLRSELVRQPEIRPEVVERARALAADPNFPSREALKKVAGFILNSADLSEDQS
ncbi:MAG: hypothetical protein ABIV50_00620 [Opitutus sp.]